MAEYTYKDVIIDPKDPRVEIGKEYYCAMASNDVISLARDGERLGKLLNVNHDLSCPYPFETETETFHCLGACLIRKKEPSYEKQQAEWVKANDIKVGDKVRALKGFVGNTKDIPYDFTYEMEKLIGKTLEVKGVDKKWINVFDENKLGNWAWPYYCLEKVEDPQFKVGDFVKEKGTEIVGMIIRKSEKGFHIYQNNPYSVAIPYDAGELEPIKAHLKPFDLKYKDTRNMLRAEWIRPKNEEEMDEAMIVGFRSYEKEAAIDLCISCDGFLSPKDALSLWCFLDGSPCGIVVEDKDE